MKNIFRILCIALVLSLASCATPYAEHGATGGYQNTQYNENTYLVSFSGNGLTSSDMVWNYWLYRCAELTHEKGYDLMVLTTAATKTSSLDSAPKFVPALFDSRDGAQMIPTHGGGSSGGSHYVYTPGYRTTTTTYSKTSYVTMFHDSDLLAPRPALRAQTVMSMLGPYVLSAGKVAPPSRAEILGKSTVTLKAMISAPTSTL